MYPASFQLLFNSANGSKIDRGDIKGTILNFGNPFNLTFEPFKTILNNN